MGKEFLSIECGENIRNGFAPCQEKHELYERLDELVDDVTAMNIEVRGECQFICLKRTDGRQCHALIGLPSIANRELMEQARNIKHYGSISGPSAELG